MHLIILIIFGVLFLPNSNSVVEKKIILLKNNNACLDCFVEISKNASICKISKILLYKQNGFYANLEAKEKMKSIFLDTHIEFINDSTYRDIRSPAILVLYIKKNNIDTVFIPYNLLFKKGTLNVKYLNKICL